MADIFSMDFIGRLANELGIPQSKLLNAIESCSSKSFPEPAPVEPSQKTVPNKATKTTKVKTIQNNEKHTCERIPRAKTEPCGKNASRFIEIDGEKHWYCGTEKSACFKSILTAQNRVTKSTASKVPSSAPKGGAKTNVDRAKESDIKSKSLADKITKKRKFNPVKTTIGKEIHYVDRETKIAFDRTTKEAYGLFKDGKIVELEDAQIRILEANNSLIREKSVKSKKDDLKKKISQKAKDDEIDKLQDEIESVDVGEESEEEGESESDVEEEGESESEADVESEVEGDESDIEEEGASDSDDIDLGSEDLDSDDIDLGSEDED